MNQDVNESVREPIWKRCGDTTPRDRRNQMRVVWALTAWALSSVGASQLIKRDLLPGGPVSWLIAGLPSLVAVLVLLAFWRYLSEADELQRLIQLGALGLGFGGTFFALTGWELLGRVGAPIADSGDFTLVMAILYSFGLWLGWRRYR